MLPLQPGGTGRFTAVREFLDQAGYGEQAVCKRLGLGALQEYLSQSEKYSTNASAEVFDRLEFLLRVFLVGGSLRRDVLDAFVPTGARESMELLGLLCVDPIHRELICSPVALYPVNGLFIVSDRWKAPDGSPLPIANDYVFPGMHPLTHDFLELLPESPCDRFLDLLLGNGRRRANGIQTIRQAVVGR